MSKKLCLQWNDFRDNVINAFGSLREDNNFADVTLACEDGKQLEAHKVILAASSPVFEDILRRNKHAHPLIFMRGVKSEDLSAIIDFLYCGEANVYQENLDSFLAISQELQLKGMVGKGDDGHMIKKEKVKKPVPKPIKKREENILTFEQILSNGLDMIDDGGTVALTKDFFGDFQDLEEQCNSMMEKTAKKQANGFPLYKCKVCETEEIKSGMKRHIEADHLEGLSVPCNYCEKTFR